MFVWKDEINDKEAGDGPFLKKKSILLALEPAG